MNAKMLLCACLVLHAGQAHARRSQAKDDARAVVTVIAPRAELRGRPTWTSSVMGLVSRGERMSIVRRSGNGRWLQVDVGAEEMMWIDAHAVESRSGAAIRPSQVEGSVTATPHIDPPDPHDEMRRIEGRGEGADDAGLVHEQGIAFPQPIQSGRHHVELHVRAGFMSPHHRVATNGLSQTVLPAYEYDTTSLAVGAALAYTRAYGRLRVHLDAKYLLGTLGSVSYGESSPVGVRDQNAGAGVAIGGFFPAAGGVDLRLRVGAEAWLFDITPAGPPLTIASDVILGMSAGLELGMPALLWIADRPVGFRIRGGAVAPATLIERAGPRTAANSTTLGAYAGASLHAGLIKHPTHGQLHFEAAYEYAFALTRFVGECSARADLGASCRDPTVSDGRAAFNAHVASLGLYYQF